MRYSGIQLFSLTLLRILVGWHFLYEGLVKLFSTPAWSAGSYLSGSIGPCAPLFKALASHPAVLDIVNHLNIWGLILIGSALFLGVFSRFSAIAGIILLSLYYLAYPPLAGINTHIPTDGNYWIVDRNLIEMSALFVLFIFPSGHFTGLDRFISLRRIRRKIIT